MNYFLFYNYPHCPVMHLFKNTVMSRQLNPQKIKKEVIALLSRCKTKLYAAPNLFNLFIQLKQHK